jgi:hypothetical protein
MPQITVPIQPDGLICDVLVGLDGKSTAALQAAGRPLLAPTRCRGEIDTGTDVTCVAAAVVRGLGLSTPAQQRTTHTVTGQVRVNLFSVSLGVVNIADPASPMLVFPTLLVMEAPAPLPNLDVLIGLDILRTIRLVVDGPAGVFTLEW